MNEYQVSENWYHTDTYVSSQRKSFYYNGFYYVFFHSEYGLGEDDVWYKCANTVAGLDVVAHSTVFGFDILFPAEGMFDLFLDRDRGEVGIVAAGSPPLFIYGRFNADGSISWGTWHLPGLPNDSNFVRISRNLITGVWYVGATWAVPDVSRLRYSLTPYPDNALQWDSPALYDQLLDPGAPGGSVFYRLICTPTTFLEIYDTGIPANGIAIREGGLNTNIHINSGIDCNDVFSEPVLTSDGNVAFVGCRASDNALYLFNYKIGGALTVTHIFTASGAVTELSLAANYADDSLFFVGRVGNSLIARLYLKGSWLDVNGLFETNASDSSLGGVNSSFGAGASGVPSSGVAPLRVQYDTVVYFLPGGVWVDVSDLFIGSTVADPQRDGYDPLFKNTADGYELCIVFSHSAPPTRKTYIVQGNEVTASYLGT